MTRPASPATRTPAMAATTAVAGASSAAGGVSRAALLRALGLAIAALAVIGGGMGALLFAGSSPQSNELLPHYVVGLGAAAFAAMFTVWVHGRFASTAPPGGDPSRYVDSRRGQTAATAGVGVRGQARRARARRARAAPIPSEWGRNEISPDRHLCRVVRRSVALVCQLAIAGVAIASDAQPPAASAFANGRACGAGELTRLVTHSTSDLVHPTVVFPTSSSPLLEHARHATPDHGLVVPLGGRRRACTRIGDAGFGDAGFGDAGFGDAGFGGAGRWRGRAARAKITTMLRARPWRCQSSDIFKHGSSTHSVPYPIALFETDEHGHRARRGWFTDLQRAAVAVDLPRLDAGGVPAGGVELCAASNAPCKFTRVMRGFCLWVRDEMVYSVMGREEGKQVLAAVPVHVLLHRVP